MRTNVLVRDLDLGVVDQFDARRLKVVVDGLPLFQGAQLAVDTTLVCPLTLGRGSQAAHSQLRVESASRLPDDGRRRVTQSWLAMEAGLAWLCSQERSEAASQTKPLSSFAV